MQGHGDRILLGDDVGELGERDRAGHHVLDTETGRELGPAGGELDDAVAARVGESLDGGVDGFRAHAVDGRKRERVFLGPAQHLRVDLGRCDGHECSSRRFVRTAILVRNAATSHGQDASGSAPGPVAWRHTPRRPRPAAVPRSRRAHRTGTAKCIVSSTSRDVPDGCPVTRRPDEDEIGRADRQRVGCDADDHEFALGTESADRLTYRGGVGGRREHDGRTAQRLQRVCRRPRPSSRCSGARQAPWHRSALAAPRAIATVSKPIALAHWTPRWPSPPIPRTATRSPATASVRRSAL